MLDKLIVDPSPAAHVAVVVDFVVLHTPWPSVIASAAGAENMVISNVNAD
jgi:hypothetical protein